MSRMHRFHVATFTDSGLRRTPREIELRVLAALIDRYVATERHHRWQGTWASTIAIHARCTVRAAQRALNYWVARGVVGCHPGRGSYRARYVVIENRRTTKHYVKVRR